MEKPSRAIGLKKTKGARGDEPASTLQHSHIRLSGITATVWFILYVPTHITSNQHNTGTTITDYAGFTTISTHQCSNSTTKQCKAQTYTLSHRTEAQIH